MVRMERICNLLRLLFVLSLAGREEDTERETASTASATASSSRVGSKKMFKPTAATRSVTGGRVV